MSIESHPFGGATLTGKDARKFRNQVRHGRTPKAAAETARRGVASAIEARRAATPKSDAVHESAVPKGDAQ